MFIIYSLHSGIILTIQPIFLATLNSLENMVGSKYISKKCILLIVILIYFLGNDDILSYLFIHTQFMPTWNSA